MVLIGKHDLYSMQWYVCSLKKNRIVSDSEAEFICTYLQKALLFVFEVFVSFFKAQFLLTK